MTFQKNNQVILNQGFIIIKSWRSDENYHHSYSTYYSHNLNKTDFQSQCACFQL